MIGSRRDLTPVEYSSRIGGGRSARLIALGIAQNPLLGMVTVYDYTIDMPPHGRFNTGDGVSASSGPEPVGPGMAELIGFGHHFQAQTAYSGFQRAVVLDLQIFGGVDPALVSR